MKKFKIRQKRKTIKTKYIFIALIIGLMLISIAYARFTTELRINGTVHGEQEQYDVTYLFFPNSASYPSTIGYMSTYTYTFAGAPTIQSVQMGNSTLVLNTDYTYTGGTLTIPQVTGNLVITGEEPEVEDFKIKYYFGDNIEFDGSTWLDTNIALFSTNNFDRNFEVTANIDSNTFDSRQDSKLNTVLNCVDHNNKPYHGFLLRRDASKYIFKVTNASNGVTETNPALNAVQNILITRTNKKIYADLTNGSNLSEVGDLSNLTQRINSSLLIGSDLKSNAPFRCFLGQMSNISVTLYYEAEENNIVLPNPVRTGYLFDGWYSNSSLTTKVGNGGANYVSTGNITLYAKWIKTLDIKVAEVNGIKYATLQEAVNKVSTNNTETIVKLLADTSEAITVKAGQNIKFDFQNYTLSNKDATSKVIDNKGTITIFNGTLTSNGATIIDNQSSGKVKLTGGRLIATGIKQAVYNFGGGTVEISGDVYISSKASGVPQDVTLERATVQNLADGIMTITGGTIIGQVQQAVSNEGTLTLGAKDGNISTSTPVIMGETYGLKSLGTFNFYDGIIKGRTDAYSGTVSDIETNAQEADGSDTINGKTYITKYLEATQ